MNPYPRPGMPANMQPRQGGLLGLGNGQFLGDALNTIGTGLLGLGAGRDDWGLLAMQNLQARQQDRLANTRQAERDQRDVQAFEFQRKKFEIEQQQDELARKAAADKETQFRALVPKLPPQLQQTALAMGPSFVDVYGKEQVDQFFPKAESNPASVQEYEYAKSQGFTGTIFDYQKAKAEAGRSPGNSTPEFGNTPIYGRDKDGNPVILRLSSDGRTVVSPMPEGVSVAPNTQFLDTGTSYVPVDKRTAGPVGAPVAKDVAGVQTQQAVGEATGAAVVSLPEVTAKADTALALIDDLLTDPNRELATGMSSFLGKVPGTPAYDYAQKVEQLKGQTFLTAFQSLKGGGAITEVEGRKAEQAIARLDAAQTEGGFTSALNELKGIVAAAKQRAIDKAKSMQGAQPSAPAAPSSAPSVGAIENGYRFKGGNPGDPNSWEKVN